MVVGGDGERLDTSVDEELGEDGLELGLTRLEIITTDEGLLPLSELDNTRNEGVLGSSVDEGLALEDGSDGEEGGGGNFRVRGLDSSEQVISGIVDTRDDIAVTLSVGGPEDDDAVQPVLLLELADIVADVLKVSLLVRTWDQVIRTSFLVGSDEVRVVDGGEGPADLSHERLDLALEIVVEDLGTLHGLVHGGGGDIPTTKNEVVGVNHREDVGNGNMDIVTSGRVGSNANSGGADDGTDIVGLLDAFLGVPDDVVTVGENGSTEGGTIVTADTDHHETSFANSTLGLELIRLFSRGDEVLTVSHSDVRTAVDEFRGDKLVSELRVLGLDGDSMGPAFSSGMNRENTLELRFGGVVPRRSVGQDGSHLDVCLVFRG
jgi:hypothetical protein